MYIGIDFGTTYSQVSTIYLDQPQMLLNPGEYGIPSVFYYDRECGILIGQDALDAGQGEAAVNMVSDVKMAILSGQSFTLDGRTFSAKEIVCEIYKALVAKAVQVARKRSIDEEIEGMVITVPAKFGIQEKHLIAEAARECMGNKNLPVRAVVKEPVAAAIAYYQSQMEDNKYILVYDLGGGTCDAALVRADSSCAEHYTVEASDMVRRGGRDWDRELAGYITENIEKKSGITIVGNPGFEEKVRRTAVSVKHDLSDPGKTRAMARVELNGRIYTVPVTRAVFDERTKPLLQETFECLQEIYDAHKDSCNIEEIICVGGSSNMLQVEEGLVERFPDCRIRLYEPEHAVVNGAAFFANMPETNVLRDVVSLSYGQATNTHYGYPDNRVIISNILKKGTVLPASAYKTYTPVEENQKYVSFRVYESDYTDEEYDYYGSDKRLVGTVTLDLPPGSPRSLELTCRIGLDSDGFLKVEASEPSGKKVNSSFKLQAL